MTIPDERSKADRVALLDRRFTELVELAIELGAPAAEAEELAENVLTAAIMSGPVRDGGFVDNESWLRAEITHAVRSREKRP